MDSIPLTPMVKKRLSDYVEDALLHYIESSLQQGQTKLPPEVELAQTLAVSRTTLRSALAELEGKGMVFRLHGKGTFINPSFNQAKLNLASTKPLLRLIECSGFSASVRPLYFYASAATPLQQSALRLEEGEPVVRVCRLYEADHVPVVLLIDDIPQKYLPAALTLEQLQTSTFDLIRSAAGIVCVRDEVCISSASSGQMQAYTSGEDLLGCSSALALDSVNFSETGQPVFASKQFFHTDYIRFNLTRTLDVYEQPSAGGRP